MFADNLDIITIKSIKATSFVFEIIIDFVFRAIIGFVFDAIIGFIFVAINLLCYCNIEYLL